MKIVLVIPAGGVGKRLDPKCPKQFISIGGIPIIARTILAAETIDRIDAIVIASATNAIDRMNDIVRDYDLRKVKEIVPGGAERSDSVYNALQTETARNSDILLVHDAARPFASESLYLRTIEAAIEHGAAIPALPPKDTIKRKTADDFVDKTLNRGELVSVQTPQAFRTKLLIESNEKFKSLEFPATDDASIVERFGVPVKIVPGEETNIKITTKLDPELAKIIAKVAD